MLGEQGREVIDAMRLNADRFGHEIDRSAPRIERPAASSASPNAMRRRPKRAPAVVAEGVIEIEEDELGLRIHARHDRIFRQTRLRSGNEV